MFDVPTEIGVRRLIDRYHCAINLQDFQLLASCFHAGSVWEARAPFNLRFEGQEAICTGLRASVGRQALLVQSGAAIKIDPVGPSGAAVTSTLIEFGREEVTGRGWSAVAFYFDAVSMTAGEWRFDQRSLQLRYEDDAPIGSGFHPLLTAGLQSARKA